MSKLWIKFRNWLLGGVWQPDPEIRKLIPMNFPKTLEGFGYKFNEKGELRNIKTGEKFLFEIRPKDHWYNQKHYDGLGEVMTSYLDGILEEECKLKKVFIPEDATEGEPQSYIFMSEDALTNPKLMILIHGAGFVRAGQWSRKLIINDCLDSGSQLPFIRQGLEEGYGIILLNTNLNTVTKNEETIPIRENENPENHGNFVWKEYIAKAAARDIAIIAHSYGGLVTVFCGSEVPKDFNRRVFAVVFTDSIHGFAINEVHPLIRKILQERGINYVSSSEPKNEPVRSASREDCRAVSAGTMTHEMTSWSSFDLIFNFLKESYDSWLQAPDRQAITEELDREREATGSIEASDETTFWERKWDDAKFPFVIDSTKDKEEKKGQKKGEEGGAKPKTKDKRKAENTGNEEQMKTSSKTEASAADAAAVGTSEGAVGGRDVEEKDKEEKDAVTADLPAAETGDKKVESTSSHIAAEKQEAEMTAAKAITIKDNTDEKNGETGSSHITAETEAESPALCVSEEAPAEPAIQEKKTNFEKDDQKEEAEEQEKEDDNELPQKTDETKKTTDSVTKDEL